MNYISAKEILKQPHEVQEVFKKWWQPKKYDLVQVKLDWTYEPEVDFILKTDGFNIAGGLDSYTKKDVICPPLTEGQLRQLIEDKTGCKLQVEYYDTDILIRVKKDRKEIKSYMFYNNNDLLQIYWKVAIEIAKEY